MGNTLKGTVATEKSLSGTLNVASGYDGKSAYEIAVKNGFEGTEAEWLASLKGSSGVYVGSGDMPEECNVQIDPDGEVLTMEQIIKKVLEQVNKITLITLYADKWEGADNLYSQVVTVPGTTENSKIDLFLTVEQAQVFYPKDVAFVAENDEGVITVYCIGQKPTRDYEIQAKITEVVIDG
jgi:hypothetical protein